jgi:hypothetical protein
MAHESSWDVYETLNAIARGAAVAEAPGIPMLMPSVA